MQCRSVYVALSAVIILSACQSIDLSQKSGPPTCVVAASDYKLLSYWNDRTADKKYPRIIALLEKKYASAQKIDGRSAVVAAQSYVRANSKTDPLAIEAQVQKACQK